MDKLAKYVPIEIKALTNSAVRRLVRRELGISAASAAGGSGGQATFPARMLSGLQLQRRTLGHLSAVYCLVFDCTGRYVITVGTRAPRGGPRPAAARDDAALVAGRRRPAGEGVVGRGRAAAVHVPRRGRGDHGRVRVARRPAAGGRLGGAAGARVVAGVRRAQGRAERAPGDHHLGEAGGGRCEAGAAERRLATVGNT